MIKDAKDNNITYKYAQEIRDLTQLKIREAYHLMTLLRTILVHTIVEQSLESTEGKPTTYETHIPQLGLVTITRNSSGSYEYLFEPTEEFSSQVTKAIEEGISPMEQAALDAAKWNLANKYKELI